MKLLAISDTHNKLIYAKAVIKRLHGKIAAVLHLGDMVADARALEAENKDITFHYVAGNCDCYYLIEKGMDTGKTVEYNGVRIFLTHGHMEGVKFGYDEIASAAKKEAAAIAVCGHTHEPYCGTVNGVLCVNPGSIAFPRGTPRVPSYAVIDIPDDGLGKPTAGVVFCGK